MAPSHRPSADERQLREVGRVPRALGREPHATSRVSPVGIHPVAGSTPANAGRSACATCADASRRACRRGRGSIWTRARASGPSSRARRPPRPGRRARSSQRASASCVSVARRARELELDLLLVAVEPDDVHRCTSTPPSCASSRRSSRAELVLAAACARAFGFELARRSMPSSTAPPTRRRRWCRCSATSAVRASCATACSALLRRVLQARAGGVRASIDDLAAVAARARSRRRPTSPAARSRRRTTRRRSPTIASGDRAPTR